MKHFIIFFLALLTIFSSSTAQTAKAIVLLKNDNSEVSVLMSRKPVITFPESTTIEIKTGNDFFSNGYLESIKIDSKDVKKITIEDVRASQIDTPDSQKATEVSTESNSLRIKVNSDKVLLEIYTLDGRSIRSETLETGETLIPLDSLPKDVIIIKVDNQTLKLLRQ
ncbi:MAG: hypothetical protein K2H76_00350 [Muribaculaceae bacterium]|nr:hypothetical protein [Muribaculaceae bacterium]